MHYRGKICRVPVTEFSVFQLNVPPSAVPKTKKRQKTQERIRRQAKPIYLHSYDDLDK